MHVTESVIVDDKFCKGRKIVSPVTVQILF